VTYCGELEGDTGSAALGESVGGLCSSGRWRSVARRRGGWGCRRSGPGAGFFAGSVVLGAAGREAEADFVREELKLEPGRFTLLAVHRGNSAQNHLALLNALVAGERCQGRRR